MRKISHFFTKQSLSYLLWIPRVFFVLKNPLQFIKSYISWNLLIKELLFKNWFIYPISNFDDLWVFYEIFIKKEYGKITKNDKIIIDIGANNGLFMLYCKWQNNNSNIYCFEPVPTCVNNIHSLIKINTLKNVHIQKVALTNTIWEATILLNTQTISATLHSNIAWWDNNIIVKTSTLAHQMQELWLSHIDFLKMDCEWSEYEIIESLSTEQLMRFRKIMIERHNVDSKKTWIKLFEILKAKTHHKYVIYTTHSWHTNNWFIKIYN